MGSNKCAYCLYHHTYMTVKHLKYKRCLKKRNGKEIGDCRHLIKLKGHIWWSERETVKIRGNKIVQK